MCDKNVYDNEIQEEVQGHKELQTQIEDFNRHGQIGTHIIHIDMMHKQKYNDKQSQGHLNSLIIPYKYTNKWKNVLYKPIQIEEHTHVLNGRNDAIGLYNYTIK